ncbi:hypothetical protein E2320_010040 [Naja naja]|nr:hypothetical protein E2320_010040 [Naja naja]
MEDTERTRLPKLNQVNQKALANALEKVNEAVQTIPTTTLAETNQLILHNQERIGFENIKNQKGKKGKPKWKIRLELKIKKLRGDLSNLKNLRQGQLKNKQTKSSLAARYDLENKEISVVIEQLKKTVVAIAEKIKRYEN